MAILRLSLRICWKVGICENSITTRKVLLFMKNTSCDRFTAYRTFPTSKSELQNTGAHRKSFPLASAVHADVSCQTVHKSIPLITFKNSGQIPYKKIVRKRYRYNKRRVQHESPSTTAQNQEAPFFVRLLSTTLLTVFIPLNSISASLIQSESKQRMKRLSESQLDTMTTAAVLRMYGFIKTIFCIFIRP